jgi:hypothetical protein
MEEGNHITLNSFFNVIKTYKRKLGWWQRLITKHLKFFFIIVETKKRNWWWRIKLLVCDSTISLLELGDGRGKITNLHLWFQLQLGSRKIWQNCYNYHLQQLWFDWLMNNSFTYNKKRKEWPQQQGIWGSFKITKTKWKKWHACVVLGGMRKCDLCIHMFLRF